jgi:hypothetical protein
VLSNALKGSSALTVMHKKRKTQMTQLHVPSSWQISSKYPYVTYCDSPLKRLTLQTCPWWNRAVCRQMFPLVCAKLTSG